MLENFRIQNSIIELYKIPRNKEIILDPSYPFHNIIFWFEGKNQHSYLEQQRATVAENLAYLCSQKGLNSYLTSGMIDYPGIDDYDFRTGIVQWPRDWGLFIPYTNTIFIRPNGVGIDNNRSFLTKQMKQCELDLDGYTFIESMLGEGGVSTWSVDGNIWLIREDLMNDPGTKWLHDQGKKILPFPHITNHVDVGDLDNMTDRESQALANLFFRAASRHIDFETKVITRFENDTPKYHLMCTESIQTMFPRQIEEIHSELEKLNNGVSIIATIPFEEESYISANSIDLPHGKLLVPVGPNGSPRTINQLEKILGAENVISFSHPGLTALTDSQGLGSIRCLSLQF